MLRGSGARWRAARGGRAADDRHAGCRAVRVRVGRSGQRDHGEHRRLRDRVASGARRDADLPDQQLQHRRRGSRPDQPGQRRGLRRSGSGRPGHHGADAGRSGFRAVRVPLPDRGHRHDHRAGRPDRRPPARGHRHPAGHQRRPARPGQGVPRLRDGRAGHAGQPGRHAHRADPGRPPRRGPAGLAARAPDLRTARRRVRDVRELRHRDRRPPGRAAQGGQRPGLHRLLPAGVRAVARAERGRAGRPGRGAGPRRAGTAHAVAGHGGGPDRPRPAHPRDPGERAGVPAHRARRLRQRDHAGHHQRQHHRHLRTAQHPAPAARAPLPRAAVRCTPG